MKFEVFCDSVAININDGGYTPLIADNDSQFNDILKKIYNHEEVEIYRTDFGSKGKTINALLATNVNSKENKVKLLNIIYDKIEMRNATNSDIPNLSKVTNLFEANIEHLKPINNPDIAIINILEDVNLANNKFSQKTIDEQICDICNAFENMQLRKRLNKIEENQFLSGKKINHLVKEMQNYRHHKDENIKARNSADEKSKVLWVKYGLFALSYIKYEVDNEQ